MEPGPTRDLFTKEYAKAILNSQFVLCPAGWGPATYRLFETMEMGRVPVTLSDEWVPPPGPRWDEFSIALAMSNPADRTLLTVLTQDSRAPGAKEIATARSKSDHQRFTGGRLVPSWSRLVAYTVQFILPSCWPVAPVANCGRFPVELPNANSPCVSHLFAGCSLWRPDFYGPWPLPSTGCKRARSAGLYH